MPKESTASMLTDDDIIDRLSINNPDIINTVYSINLDLLYKEEERTKNIDTKGSTLLGVSGLTSTVVFSLGGLLIEKIPNIIISFYSLQIPTLHVLSFLYITSSITLLGSILFAVLAIKSRSDFKWINGADVFNKEMLSGYVLPYKRYLTSHYWMIFSNNFKINEIKGKLLKKGYWVFFIALIQILPIILIIGLYSYTKGDSAMSDNETPKTPKPSAGVSRTSNVSNSNNPKPAPTPKPSSGTLTTKYDTGSTSRKR
jgi:hypothetical protein